jgi:putative Mg2+ transporter-C (MgtC) family protein
LGYQRERQGKAAGLRTHMLVALGATLFVFIPLQAGMALADLGRCSKASWRASGFSSPGRFSSSRPQSRSKG